MANSDGVKFYLDYLDKEMTIMGILSGFCVAVLALVVDKIALAKDSPSLASLWSRQENHWLIGLTALLLAALLFYLQRSYLAFYYGQIALAQARGAKSYYSVDDLLFDAASSAKFYTLYLRLVHR